MVQGVRFVAAAAALVGAAAVVIPAPGRPDGPVALRDEVAVKADGVGVNAFALLPDGRSAVVVGVKAKDLDEAAAATEPGGAIVDLGKKAAAPFVNGHTGPIGDVGRSADGARVYTVGRGKDAVVRVWDVAAGRSAVFADFGKEVEADGRPTLAVVGRTGRVAVALDTGVAVVGAGGAGRVDLGHPEFGKTVVSHPTAGPDGAALACRSFRGKVLVWDVKAAKVVADVAVIPAGADPANWTISDLAFGPGAGELLVCRYTSEADVPAGEDEGKVGAERRAVWAMDLAKKSVRPLGLGHTIHTYRMAVHPGGRWLALVGDSRGEGDLEEKATVGEVRVYDLPARGLALKRQFADFFPMWVAFSADGRRLACASPDGEVRAWEFVVPGK